MCPAARAFPPPLGSAATRHRSSDGCRSLLHVPRRCREAPRRREPVLTMSVALSNRFQGRRHCPPSAPPPARSPAPPSLRAVSPAGHLCAPGGPRGLPRAGSRRGPGSTRPGETPASRAVSLSLPGGKAFGLLKARQERRLAEINRVSARRWGSLRGAGAVRRSPPKLPMPGGFHLRLRGCACRRINPLSSPGLPAKSSLRPCLCASDSR